MTYQEIIIEAARIRESIAQNVGDAVSIHVHVITYIVAQELQHRYEATVFCRSELQIRLEHTDPSVLIDDLWRWSKDLLLRHYDHIRNLGEMPANKETEI